MYRAGIIGATGRGAYGYGLNRVFEDSEGVDLVAVADAEGLQAAGEKLGVSKFYADYREMLEREGLDIVSIGPRWVTDRRPKVEAAAAAGCHVYCEKPFSGSLADANAMIAACEKAGVRIGVAHQFRGMPPVPKAIEEVKTG